jgi:hypothetical protein
LVLKETSLTFTKRANVNFTLNVDAHFDEGRPMRNWRDNHPAIAFEGDETFIEKMIDCWRQQQAIFAI